MALNPTSINVVVNTALTKTPGVSTPVSTVLINRLVQLVDGTTAGKADRLYVASLTIGASSNTDLDLAGGVTDDFGQTITFARVKALWAVARAANTNDVLLGAAAANPWTALLGATGTLRLRPDTAALVYSGVSDATGYAIVAGTGDVLRVANSAGGTSVTVDLVIIGASA